MPAKHKLVSHAARKTRQVMVSNLMIRIDQVYPTLSITAAFERIGQDTGISLSSFQRIMSGRTGPSIDTLSDIAHNLGMSVGDFFKPVSELLPAAPAGAVAQSLPRKLTAK